jgi:hypothetical protein
METPNPFHPQILLMFSGVARHQPLELESSYFALVAGVSGVWG